MSDQNYAYPFDPTGEASTNKITGEQHIVTPPNGREFYFVVPKACPFFRDSLVVKLHNGSGVTELQEGIDYTVSHHFLSATRACAQPVNGSITFLSREISGVVELDYQTVGGMWTIDTIKIMEILANKILNPRITTWEEIVDLPEAFPPIDHEWDLVDLVGMAEVEEKLEEIEQAILVSAGNISEDHKNNTANPHQVTKTQVGLGFVENYPVASLPEAVAGVSQTAYITPYLLMQTIRSAHSVATQTHLDSRNNPHEVTKTQVGLGSVLNFGIATKGEAEGGGPSNKYMTPERTKEAIVAQVGNDFAAHKANEANPHNVTKIQVGLSNVQNYPIANETEAVAGTAGDRYMTPVVTKKLVETFTAFEIAKHAADYNNPHRVDKEDVGLGNVANLPLASEVLATEGTVDNHYMTPLRTRQAIEHLVTTRLIAHELDNDNPHGVTKSDVGLASVPNFTVATEADARSGTSNSMFMTPLRVKQAIIELANASVTAHAENYDNPHNVSKTQVGLGMVQNYAVADSSSAVAGASNALYMTPVRTKEAVLSILADAGVITGETTVEDLGGMTAEDIGSALDTKIDKGAGIVQLGGMTVAQIQSLLDTKHDNTVTVGDIGGYSKSYLDSTFATKMDATAGVGDLGGLTATDILNRLSGKLDTTTTVGDLGGLTSVEINNLLNTKMDASQRVGDLGGMTTAQINTELSELNNSLVALINDKLDNTTTVSDLGGYTKGEVDNAIIVLQGLLQNNIDGKLASTTTVNDLGGLTTAEIESALLTLEAAINTRLDGKINITDRSQIIAEAEGLGVDYTNEQISGLDVALRTLIELNIPKTDRATILSEALTAAKAYSDANGTDTVYVDQGDADTLAAAKSYADNLDTATPSEVSQAEAAAIAAAKVYTDAQIVEITAAFNAATASL